MTTPNGTFSVRDEAAIRDAWLRTVSNAFQQYGLQAPNILPGSELYIRAKAFARQLTVTESNAVIAVDGAMPDSATGTNLQRWLSIIGLSQRDAGGSAGNITITCTQNTAVPIGTTLVDQVGLRYQVAVGGTYANQAQVPITAVDGGVATNHVNGDTL